jgi:hypothetical protein
MTVSEIIENLKKLTGAFQPDGFIYDFLTALPTDRRLASGLNIYYPAGKESHTFR